MTKVLIIGRPNVGKSSLFNRLIKKKRAVVLNSPGVTRDILKQKTCWWGRNFEVWDSGGWMEKPDSSIFSSVKKKVEQSVREADLIVFVASAHTGLTPEDVSIFKLIHNKKYLLVVNKVDHPTRFEDQIADFWKLKSSFIKTSFEKNEQVDQIVEWIIKNSKDQSRTSDGEKFSILTAGQPNVGKSTLCNKILRARRMVTSPQAHTTVDVVSSDFEFEGKKYIISDTAGVKKQSQGRLNQLAEKKTLDFFYSVDFVLLVIDPLKGFSRQDVRLLSHCLKSHKAFILAVNKWDLMKGESRLQWRKKVASALPFFPHETLVFTSAKTGLGVKQLMRKIDLMIPKILTRIPTSKLNVFFSQVVENHPPPSYGTKNIKFYYLTQTKTKPPGFTVFTNEPKGVPSSYQKFLIRKIQTGWGLKGIPIEMRFVKKT